MDKLNSTIDPIGIFRLEDRILMINRNYLSFVKVETIYLIIASKDYTEILVKGGRVFLHDRSMNEWERRLPSENFCRVHRSYIVNIDAIIKCVRTSSNTANLYLLDQENPIKVSRHYFYEIKRFYL